jgi:tRNA(adenine34) deaminase
VTAHAEIIAITAASNFLGAKYLKDCTLYVTLEPCPMCAAAIKWSRIGRIVYAASDPKGGYSKISNEILDPKTEVSNGILKNECSELMTEFFRKKR